MSDFLIVTECYFDTYFIERLMGFKGREVNHAEGGKTDVINLLKRRYLPNGLFGIGIVDEDRDHLKRPNKNPLKAWLIESFEEIEDTDSTGLSVLPNSQVYCITVKPALEIWLMKCLEAINMTLTDFEVEDHHWRPFKKLTGRRNSGNNPQLIQLVDVLLTEQPPMIAGLKGLIDKLLTEAG